MTPQSLSNSVRDVLDQGLMFLDRVGSDFARPLPGVFAGTLGAHYRHVLDHFLCLVEGIRTGEVNYDRRRRSPDLETSAERARLVTEGLMHEFAGLPSEAAQRDCIVTYSVGYGEDGSEATASNVAREIMFCVGHAIHHYAIIKLLCAGIGVELPFEFGVAPSTLKHLEAQVEPWS